MQSYWHTIWKQFKKRRLSTIALFVVGLYALIGLYAPFLASSKPFWVYYNGDVYFPLFRYLFFSGFFTKRLDIFFNLLMLLFPLGVLAWFILRNRRWMFLICLVVLIGVQVGLFLYFILRTPQDPQADPELSLKRYNALVSHPLPNWNFDLQTMTPYAKLNLLLREKLRNRQQQAFQVYAPRFAALMKEEGRSEQMPTLWQLEHDEEARDIATQRSLLSEAAPHSEEYQKAEAKLDYLLDRRKWIENETANLHGLFMPLIRPFHWEDDAGGSQSLNQIVSWWDLTRINRKDLVAALIFGMRISLVVGLVSVAIALSIAVPIGSLAGFYGGTFDILVSRLLEIWEAMPTFFMLLLVVAITQSKSIFLVIAVIGLFGWTSFSRFLRGEFFKQRNLLYVEACHALGFNDARIIFSHILPNAIPPLLTLLPFAIMGAITSEAGLSFLGLGEEGSCSWGVLMDEGRTAFPGESYLLWPPAILLTVLLIAIALVGDGLRDALDPKTYR